MDDMMLQEEDLDETPEEAQARRQRLWDDLMQAILLDEDIENDRGETSDMLGCDGFCEPMCAECHKLADQAADNRVIDQGY